MALFNVFSDPKIAAQQAQLDAQWSALNGLQNDCQNVPDTSWVEFVNDLKSWREFYASGSDWTMSSANATNAWQAKAKDWSARLASYGCTGSLGSIGDVNVAATAGDLGVPGVKDPPSDQQSWLDRAEHSIANTAGGFWSTLTTVGWIAIGLVTVILIAIVYLATRVKVSSPGVGSIG